MISEQLNDSFQEFNVNSDVASGLFDENMEVDLPNQSEITSKNVADRWKNYLETRKAKLMHQINVVDAVPAVSKIFENISIFVNGYTNPPSSELRRLIQMHGGSYHSYYEYGITSYTVATNLATTKARKLRRNEKIIDPKWVTDCIEAGQLLPDRDYLLLSEGNRSARNKENVPSTSKGRDLNAATDQNFIDNFYQRSRLHLISTLAQEMKQFVSELREKSQNDFSSRSLLSHLVSQNKFGEVKESICHIDLDCFFVSVALIDRPDLVGKPIAITHSKGTDSGAGMSEIASCSYEARKRGIRNGAFVKNAKLLEPNLICLPYQFDDYRRISKMIYSIVSCFTLDIRAVSCDEMYVDLSSLCIDMGINDVSAVVSVIRSEIERMTKCIASVGIGPNMLLARLATRHAKPNGQYIVMESEVESFIKAEKISDLPGIGYNMLRKLRESFGEQLTLCEELQKIEVSALKNVFGGKTSEKIYNACRGIDTSRDFLAANERKSISCDINYGIRFKEDDELYKFVGSIAVQLEKKLNWAGMSTSAITLRLMIRSAGAPEEPEKFLGHGQCDVITKSILLMKPTSNALILLQETKKLIKNIKFPVNDLRGIGIHLTRLTKMTTQTSRTLDGVQTLTQYFAVRAKNLSNKCYSMKKHINVENKDYEKSLKQAIRLSKMAAYDERCHRRQQILGYQNHYDELDVKAAIGRMLDTFDEPTEIEILRLMKHLYSLVRVGNTSRLVSLMRFFERKALAKSFEWNLVAQLLKVTIIRQCKRAHNCKLHF